MGYHGEDMDIEKASKEEMEALDELANQVKRDIKFSKKTKNDSGANISTLHKQKLLTKIFNSCHEETKFNTFILLSEACMQATKPEITIIKSVLSSYDLEKNQID